MKARAEASNLFSFVNSYIVSQITTQSFLIFSCKRMGLQPEDLYLYADLTQQCWTQKHWAWGLGLGVRFSSYHNCRNSCAGRDYKIHKSYLY
jgi:hypothetical protein